MLFASISDTPHVFLNFANSGTSCGDTGNVVFTVSDTNKCAEPSPFALTSEGHIAFHSGTGTFLVCGADKHVSLASSFFRYRWKLKEKPVACFQ